MTPSTQQHKPCVLLLSPGILKWTDADFGLPHLVSLGGYLLRELPVRVEILDLNYEGGDHRRLLQTLEGLGASRFLLIGVACYSSYDYLRVMTLARFLRRRYPGVPLVAGGYHASACPDDLLVEGSPFDAVVVGEGERPLRSIAETLLGGGRLDGRIHGPDPVPELDDLPPYRWELLSRYWPRARQIGGKLQIYLSRGCPYHCTFCMERAKSDYRWRSFSPERALEELRRLARFTALGDWVVNVADPLFGFQRAWRRSVLEGIVREELLPRQYWTLTRTDDLDEEDVRLLAAARFSIGLGLESGSPELLRRMQKTKQPERYLAAVERLAERSRRHGLTWAANIIVGHPGETPETFRETAAFVTRLFTREEETRGWLSIDPFRLYPGSHVHEHRAAWERDCGTRFHDPTWWTRWYDTSFRSEFVDPSATMRFEDRVREMYAAYGPLVRRIVEKFRGQGRTVDRVFSRSVDEQVRLMSPELRDRLLRTAARARASTARAGPDHATVLPGLPFGLHVRDPWVRHREEAVRRLLENGVVRSETLLDALLTVPPERWLGEDEARSLLSERGHRPPREGEVARWIGWTPLAIGLEALQPQAGDRVADLAAATGYVAALLSALVGGQGRVVARAAEEDARQRRELARGLRELGNVELVAGDPTSACGLAGPFDGLWLGGGLPRFPREWGALLRDPGGRAVVFLGPRFRPRDLVCLERRGERQTERVLARVGVPVLAGVAGWRKEIAP